ncbi:hypothetical protein LUZ60_008689 [Juncus effusus]|nr:hypothetical protein LUZ60_008689 [Juncus effusus]
MKRMWRRRWKRAMKTMSVSFSSCCLCFFHLPSSSLTKTIACSAVKIGGRESTQGNKEKQEAPFLADKCICAICLDQLYGGEINTKHTKNTEKNETRIFIAECSHSFHFTCIASNIRHGNVTCPICRAEWTQLPNELKLPPSLSNPQNADPIIRMLDHSIATSRVNRRSSIRLVRYNDDDPIDSNSSDLPEPTHPSLQFSLVPVLNPNPNYRVFGRYSCAQMLNVPLCQTRAYLSVSLAPQPATDLVLVVTCNGPHIRLLKQSMALVVFSLRAIDRLSIVTYSTTATRALPLRRMSPHGKRLALQVIDRTCYAGGVSPLEGLQKGVKILEDRTHRNPIARILHISDGPNRIHCSFGLSDSPFLIHQYHIGFGFGNGFVMHEFEDFVSGLLGGVVGDVRLRIGESIGSVRIGDLRGGEERRIPLDLINECGYVSVQFSYCCGEERETSGELAVGFGEKRERSESDCEERERDPSFTVPRRSCGERREYLDPFVARRWAKHLNGYRTRRRDERRLV